MREDTVERRRALLRPGVERARRIRGVRLREKGQIRSAPNAKWTPFEAVERISTERSEFRWEARFKGLWRSIPARRFCALRSCF